MSASEYNNQKAGEYNSYGPPSGPPPGLEGQSDRGMFGGNNYPQQPQPAYGQAHYNGPPQQYYPQQGGYYPPPQPNQQGYYPPQGGPVYVQQQQPQKGGGDDCLMGCCAALCVCCALDALC
ncbi:hypothetical protein V1512DRAFT_263673 [Lipomyces arxii]|uniref:uncharacterized protein n=1 Tax=Lipomyces arxii TaxID=56418 RepID=UPI0034CFC461